MRRVSAITFGFLCLSVTLVVDASGSEQLLHKILHNQATKTDMITVFSRHNVADLSTAASFSIRARGNVEIENFVRALWRGDRKSYPSLAWNEIDQPRVRVALAQTLGQIDVQNLEYYEYIKSALQDKQEQVRASAALALGIVGSDQDIPLLVHLSESESSLICTYAIEGLGALGTEKSRIALRKLASEAGLSVEKRRAIESALAQ